MANIINAADILGGGGIAFMSKDDKEQLHRTQEPFWITTADAEREGQFGIQTIFSIRTKEGADWNLAFSASASRISQAKRVVEAVAKGADAVGPCYLGKWAANGKSGWQLTFEPTTTTEAPVGNSFENEVKQTVASVTPVETTDSDIPF
jgi:hypothetical protein